MSYMCVINPMAEKWQEIPFLVMVALCARVGYSALLIEAFSLSGGSQILTTPQRTFLHTNLYISNRFPPPRSLYSQHKSAKMFPLSQGLH